MIGEGIVLVNQRFDQTLADRFSFEENLKFGCMGAFPSLFSRLKKPSFYPALIEKFNIDLSLPAYMLSGGQRQILALLMKMQRKSRIMLLDEPTATLDEENARLVFAFLHSLENITLLVTCHDQKLLSEYTTGKHLHLHIAENGMREIKFF